MDHKIYFFVIIYSLLAHIYIFLLPIPEWYAMITIYLCFKWVFNYRKCTLSYIEVKVRDLDLKHGILYNFLEDLIDFRYNILINYIYILQFVIIFKYYFLKKLMK